MPPSASMVIARRPARPVGPSPRVLETAEHVDLSGGRLTYTLRRSSRSRGLRVTIHPDRGVVVSVPLPTRRGWANPVAHVEGFLRARERWVRSHVAEQTARRSGLHERPALGEGRAILVEGVPRVVRVVAAPGLRHSRVIALTSRAGDELLVERAPGEHRS